MRPSRLHASRQKESRALLRDRRLPVPSHLFSTVPDGLYGGNAFCPPTRTLVDKTIPSISEPPGNP
jgi:hypothetical protein